MQRLVVVALACCLGAAQAATQTSGVASTELTKQSKLQSDWGLSDSEASRYAQALARLAPFLDVENIGPLEVLGMSAESEQEKRALAHRHVRAMLAHQVKAIEWSLYVEEAAKAVKPGQVIAELSMVDKALKNEGARLQGRKTKYFSRRLGTSSSRSTSGDFMAQAAIASRLVLFVEPACAPCDLAFDEAREKLSAGQLLGVDVVFAGMKSADKRVITEWAIKRGIQAESVTRRVITLNYENDAWEALRADREVPVAVRAGKS
jgi:integrating conjugative element protein (TIGR03759 family)